MADDYFVGIYDPLDVRRNILESSRQVIKSLECHDSIDRIRAEKMKCFKEMKRIMAELDELSARMKKSLPKASFRKEDPEVKEHEEEHAHANSKFSEELKLLEEQLKSIEKELSVFK